LTENSFKPYWASVPAKEIADNILEKVDDYYEYLSVSGRLDLWRRSWQYYYRPRVDGGILGHGGQQGELTLLSANHYRNLLSHLETMTTQQRANFEPRATNSDQESQSQVILAASLLDYYMREKKLERNFKQSVKDALMWAEGFLRVEWDATGGEVYGKTETGAAIYQGDLKYSNYTPFNVIRDFTLQVNSKSDWKILRDFKNKYDLAAKFPDLAEDILSDCGDALSLLRTTTLNYQDFEDSNNIAVYTLLHPKTPAMPQGRYTEVLDNGTVLMDGPLPYEETHVYRIAPDEESGTIFGYTVAFDLLPLQETLDILYSTVISNQSTFGTQNILLPKGHDLSTSQLAGGLNVLECDYSVGKPEALNLTSTPPEIFNFITQIEHQMELISGVNNVARGNVERDMSGAALALVQSMAIQFNNSLQQSYAQIVEDGGTGSIKVLQVYASVPRVAEIVGKSNRPYLKKFKGSDLSLISRVTVDMGNPMMNTIAGKTNLADNYMKYEMIDNPDQYVQVITTGRLEPVVEGKQANLLLIKGENELLAEGKPQRALITDYHAKHILEHTIILANPEIRQSPDDPIVQMALDHIQEHIAFAQSPGYQMMAAMLGHELLVAPAMPQMPPQDGGTGSMLNNTNPAVQAASEVPMPNMPSAPPGTDPNSQAVIEGQAG
jgi:hypothetical protein